MRLKTKIIIDAELKRAQGLGLFGTIINKGDEGAGQIFLIITNNADKNILIGPAMGSVFDEEGNRLWSYPLGSEPVERQPVDKYLEKAKKFDRDIYILEIEDMKLAYRPSGIIGLNGDSELQQHQQNANKLFNN